MTVRRRYLDTPEGQLHYRERPGDGSVLLLLHQTPSSSRMWQRVLEAYPAGRRVIAVDSPGFGDSDPPAELPDAGMTYYAERIAGFLDALGIDRADVAGHHTGAVIAAELAVLRPELVGRLVLIGPVIVTAEEGAAYLAKTNRFTADFSGDFLADALLPQLHAAVTRDDPAHFVDELVARLQAGPQWWWIYEGVFGYDGHARMPQIQASTLAAVGGAEAQIMHDWTAGTAAVIPDCQFEVWPDLELEMTYQEPAATVAAIERFLAA